MATFRGKPWALAALALPALLAGCGSGARVRAQAPPPPAPVVEDPVVTERHQAWMADSQYAAQTALGRIHAAAAYGNDINAPLASGEGIYVAVLDDGIQHHRAFQDSGGAATRLERINTLTYTSETLRPVRGENADISITLATPRTDASFQNPNDSEAIDHGTAVASVLAGGLATGSNRDSLTYLSPNSNVLGVAFGAGIIDIPYFSLSEHYCAQAATPCEVPSSSSDEQRATAVLRRFAAEYEGLGASLRVATEETAAGNTARYANVSTHIETYMEPSSGNAGTRALLNRAVALWASALAQESGAGTSETVFVISAGNDYDDQEQACVTAGSPGGCALGANPAKDPLLLGSAPVYYATPADIQPNMLVVVALDAQGRIADFSNRCGIAANWCLAAPGTGLRIAEGPGTHAGSGSGTSFAAPLVTGALALLDDAFSNPDGTPAVSPAQVAARVLASANDGGIFANTAIYGQGSLDIAAALRAQGALGLSTTGQASVTSRQARLHSLRLALPTATRQALAGASAMALDEMGFPVFVPAERLLAPPPAQRGWLQATALGPSQAGTDAQLRSAGFSAGLRGDGWIHAFVPGYMAGPAPGAPGGIAAAHLYASPLVGASLPAHQVRFLRLQADLGRGMNASAAVCRRHGQADAAETSLRDDSGSCAVLAWDWASAERGLGLHLSAQLLQSRDGAYGLGLRCQGAARACDSPASAAEFGLGGFAAVSPGLRLAWRHWRGSVGESRDDGLVRYGEVRHDASSLSLGHRTGAWSLYLQQPLRLRGALRLRLPATRTPEGEIGYRDYRVRLDDAPAHLRLGFAARFAMNGTGGAMHLDLGGERGLDGLDGIHPYVALETRLSW